MPDDLTPEEAYDTWWADIVETDGVMDPEKVKLELADYLNMMGWVSSVYSEVTSGMISKPHTDPNAVIAVHEEECRFRQQINVYPEDLPEGFISKIPEMIKWFDTLDKFIDLKAAEGDASAVEIVEQQGSAGSPQRTQIQADLEQLQFLFEEEIARLRAADQLPPNWEA